MNPYFKTFKTTNAFTQHRKPQLFEVSFDSCRLTAKGSFLQNFLRSSSVFPRAYCNPLIFNYSSLLKNLVCHHLLSLLFFLLLWQTTLTLPEPHPTITMCVIFIWLWTLPSFARFAISLRISVHCISSLFSFYPDWPPYWHLWQCHIGRDVWVGNREWTLHLWIKLWWQFLFSSLTLRTRNV